MNGKIELQLEATSGALKATWVSLPGRTSELSLEVPLWSSSTRQEIIRLLALNPVETYALLQGRAPRWFIELGTLPADIGETVRSLAKDFGLKDDDLLNGIQQGLAEQPLLVLILRGFPKNMLLDAVFACWVEAETPSGDRLNPPGGLAAELARLERKGPVVSTGEWLAEAAAEGSLHQPGPLFHEVGDRTFPSEPVIAIATENWQGLLPQTPKVQDGLALIMNRVAEAAARRAIDAKGSRDKSQK